MLLYTAELKRSISEPLSSKKAAVDQVCGGEPRGQVGTTLAHQNSATGNSLL